MLRSSVLFLVPALLAACSSNSPAVPPPARPLERDVPQWVRDTAEQTTPEKMKRYLERLDAYISTLNLFNSSDPRAWAQAQERLERDFANFYIDAEYDEKTRRVIPKDPLLIRQTRSADPAEAAAARRELGRRARIFINCWVFTRTKDLEAWRRAFEETKTLGKDAEIHLAYTLLQMLAHADRRPMWPHVRSYLLELGEIAYEVIRSYLELVLLPRVPEAWVFVEKEDLEQSIVVLINIGPGGRAYVMELAKHPKWYVRKSVALAIGEANEIALMEVLEDYIRGDPRWEVRMAAYRALGRMTLSRDRAVRLLVRALEVEKEESCLKGIATSLGELKATEAVPALIAALDHPSYDVIQAVMEALERITGASRQLGRKLRTPYEWKQWYGRNR